MQAAQAYQAQAVAILSYRISSENKFGAQFTNILANCEKKSNLYLCIDETIN
jgi:hypothetical protein